MRAAETYRQHPDEVTREIRHGLLWALGLRLAEEEAGAGRTRSGRWAAPARPPRPAPAPAGLAEEEGRSEEEDVRGEHQEVRRAAA